MALEVDPTDIIQNQFCHVVKTVADLPMFGSDGNLYFIESDKLLCRYHSNGYNSFGEYIPLQIMDNAQYGVSVKAINEPSPIIKEESKPQRPNRLKEIFGRIKSRP